MTAKKTAKIVDVELKNVNIGVNNTYRVQKRQWNEWSYCAKGVFNEVYSSMIHNQDLFMHPAKSIKQTPEAWKTTAWNAAWTAAEAVDRIGKGQ